MTKNSWRYWFSDASVETLRKVHDGLKNKSVSRNNAVLIQNTMNYICTFMNSTLFSADHVLRAMFIRTLVQRDAFIDKIDKDVSETSKPRLPSAPFRTEALFADEVQPLLHKLEIHKQANKPVKVHVSVHKDSKPDRRLD